MLPESFPADLAVLTTAGVMTLLCGRVTRSGGSSQGTTCSIWYLSRRAIKVTCLAGMGEAMGWSW